MAGKRVTPIDVEVGHRIRVARKAAKMSQETLADALGVTFQQVQKYENGTNRVSSGRLTQVADALNVPIASFFEGNNQTKVGSRPSAAELLAQPYALRLAQAFAALPDANAQRLIVHLVEKMAGKDGGIMFPDDEEQIVKPKLRPKSKRRP